MLAATDLELREDFTSFLERDLRKDLLRFTTAGSVDDGKSTLIGRLLHDSKAVYEDQLSSVKKSRVNRSGRAIDFSLLTDGLRAEREQGITIDVAYRYFSTARRKFIIADTPGHEQYTRNMATGASTADLAVILVDGTKGLLAQTRRHAYISALLGISKVVAAINKMDLVGYREELFLELEQQFRELAESLGIESVQCIPISALEGDNVVERSVRMPWYAGRPTLIEYLETVDIRRSGDAAELRFPIQQVIRPDAGFRGFAGTVASGTIRPGDQVLALPSRQQTSVRAIVTYDGELDAAVAKQSVVLQLADEIDLSRGDLLVSPEQEPTVSERFTAKTVWMHGEPLRLNQAYLVKHCGRQIKARATRVHHRVNINDFTEHPADQLEMNEIGLVEFKVSSPLVFDSYAENHATGSFILIDPLSNATVGAAMIQTETSELDGGDAATVRFEGWPQGKVSAEQRSARHRHLPAVIAIEQQDVAERLEETLFARGFEALLVRGSELSSSALSFVVSALWSAGLVVVYAGQIGPDRQRELQAISEGRFLAFTSSGGLLAAEEIQHQAATFAESLRIVVDPQRN